ncbi:histidine phosphotransferase family protein [uncultured Roseovarius sp.]|uniref:histidine phosphotransferase family protein n=1 Tax=uncultured Roseovarius sp. TaxID=293344 RepID=UPI002629C6E6|nr:histidine phosphotransferase family protein [uncultured Roseovarius sp.]
MTNHTANVAALIGSRICHDLISPVGAVTNGLELLAMSGVSDSPELSLVNSSAADASARIKLFRLAFGTASDGQKTGSDELRRILSDHYSDGRINVQWQPQGDIPRKVAKAAVLGVLCVEQSLPFGGELQITTDGERWSVTGTSDRIKERPELWDGLMGKASLDDLAPADVQYLLLNVLLDAMGRDCSVSASDNAVSLRF